MPAINEDIERIEVAAGPASALYGPNGASGVIHIITRSPFDFPGTTVSLGAGERNYFSGSFRHAARVNSGLAFKLTGHAYRGDDWPSFDQAEPDSVQKFRATSSGRVPVGNVVANERDFEVTKFSLEGGLYFRFGASTSLTLNTAFSEIKELSLSGQGASIYDGWQYGYGQLRFSYKDLFVQAFINTNSAGNSHRLRTGGILTDKSKFISGQIQHSISLYRRQHFIYGIDLSRTLPDTENTIYGRHEDHDNFDQIGAYLQSETTLSGKLNLVTAARIDDHSLFEHPVFSPRAALVFKPEPVHSWRVTFNRAYSTPPPGTYFLDLLVASDRFGVGSRFGFEKNIDLRSFGHTSGLHFSRTMDGVFQFRSPFAPTGSGGLANKEYISLHNSDLSKVVWQTFRPELLGGIQQRLQEAGLDNAAIANLMIGLDEGVIPPTLDSVQHQMRSFNLQSQQFTAVSEVPDFDPIAPTINETFEIGYKGLIADKLALAVDIYHTNVHDFIAPLALATPNVFFEETSLQSYLQAEISSNLTNLDETQLSALNTLDAPGLPQNGNGNGSPADEVATLLAEDAANIPFGTVSPEEAFDPFAVLLSYRNFGDVSFSGIDVGITCYIDADWTLSGNYSYVSDNLFPRSESQANNIYLNIPQHKGAIGLRFERENVPIHSELRGRYVGGFPFRAGVYSGDIESYLLIDVNVGYTFSNNFRAILSIDNVLNNKHLEMTGAPKIGRFAVLRLTKSF